MSKDKGLRAKKKKTKNDVGFPGTLGDPRFPRWFHGLWWHVDLHTISRGLVAPPASSLAASRKMTWPCPELCIKAAACQAAADGTATWVPSLPLLTRGIVQRKTLFQVASHCYVCWREGMIFIWGPRLTRLPINTHSHMPQSFSVLLKREGGPSLIHPELLDFPGHPYHPPHHP